MTSHSIAILLALFAALTELFSRYGQELGHLLRVPLTYAYAALHVGAAAAFVVIFSNDGGLLPVSQPAGLGLLAGLLAPVVLRTHVLVVRVGEQDIQLGPAAILTSMLASMDRDIDRARAADRVAWLRHRSAGLTIEEATRTLPSLLLSSAAHTIPRDELSALAEELSSEARSDEPAENTKARAVMKLADVFGIGEVDRAIRILRGTSIEMEDYVARAPAAAVFGFGSRIRETVRLLRS